MTKEEYWQKYDSESLCMNYSNDFDIWWNTDLFNWSYSWALIVFISNKFDTWWNPDKFNYKYCCGELCFYLPNKFDKWWNPEKFNWDASSLLCINIPDKFDIWWDPEKFKWFHNSILNLISYILHKITDWYIPEIEIIYPKNIIDIKDIKKFISNFEWNYE